MKLTADISTLEPAVAFVARYAARAGGGAPALAGVRIEASGDRVLLRAYDHEAAGAVDLPLAADEPGTVLVPGSLLADILHTLPPGQVRLRELAGTLEITGGDQRTGDIRFTLPTLPPEDQPDPPTAPADVAAAPAEAFARAVRRVGRLAARDDLVPVLTGTLLRIEPDRLTVAATDRYRIGICELPWSRPPNLPESGERDVVVPARLVSDTAAGFVPSGDLELGVAEDRTRALLGIRSTAEDQVRGQVRGAVLRLLEGRFPPLRPRGAATEDDHLGAVTVDAEELRSAIARVCLVADRHAAVVLDVRPGQLTVHASGAGPADGSAAGVSAAGGSQTMPAELEGSGTVTAYNASYLRDGLDFVADGTVRLAFREGTRAASLLTSPDRPGYRYVVMPRHR